GLLEQSRPSQVLSNALFTHRTFRSGARSVDRRPLDGVGRQLAPGPYARAGPSVNRCGMTSQTGFSPAQALRTARSPDPTNPGLCSERNSGRIPGDRVWDSSDAWRLPMSP